MTVSYKRMWKLLIDMEISAAELRRRTALSSCTMTKLRRDEPVTVTVLMRIAKVLECTLDDICEFIDEDEQAGGVRG